MRAVDPLEEQVGQVACPEDGSKNEDKVRNEEEAPLHGDAGEEAEESDTEEVDEERGKNAVIIREMLPNESLASSSCFASVSLNLTLGLPDAVSTLTRLATRAFSSIKT